MTSLNIGTVTPDRPRVALKPGPCPACGAKPDARVTEGSFGTNTTRVMCGNCGHHFKETP
jgi:predicted Zn finger-like uncharacterized protein